MDELKPCPFCGQKAERSPINGSVCCPVRGIGKHTDYLRPDVWQTRPLEDALQNQLSVMSEHSAALAVSNYELITENNDLQKRVEELESRLKQALHFEDDTADGYDWQVLESAFKYDDLRTSLNEAVKEIENKMSEWDGYERTGYMMWDALDILRKHGLVEDK